MSMTKERQNGYFEAQEDRRAFFQGVHLDFATKTQIMLQNHASLQNAYSKSIAYRQGTSTREGPQSVNYPRPPL